MSNPLAAPPAEPPARGPTVSVVIPCYNARRWIGATLHSVFAQELGAAEVIVVDDGSTDGTAEMLSREFPQVRLVHQANAGVAAARNRGVREARSDWVAFVDADDYWLPSKLRLQFDALASMPAAQLVYAAWVVWPATEAEPAPHWLAQDGPASRPAPGPSGWIYCDLLLDCEVWTSTTVIRRELFLQLGGFDESLPIGEDYDLWLRVSRQTPVVRVDKPQALYRQHPASLTRLAPRANWQGLVIERALGRWGLDDPSGRRADAGAVARALARSWSTYAYAHLMAGNGRMAITACARALRLHWADVRTWKLLGRSMLATCGIRRGLA